MLEYIFKAVLVTSLIGTALTLFLTLIKPITQRYFSRRWNYYVWLVVLIAMIVPFRFAEPTTTQQSEAHTFYSPIQEFAQDEPSETNKETLNPSAQIFEKLKVFAESQMNTFALIWFLGACRLFLSKLMVYGVFLIKLKKCTDAISCPELQQFTDRKIITRVGDKFSSPFMVGVSKPMLILPKNTFTDEQLNNVLSHEITHFKRKDILYKWFACLVKCIHWFNPIIYYVGKQVNIECEISCDAEVAKDMSDEQQTRYIDTIITMLASGNKKYATITTGMASDKKTLQRRFTMIKNNMKISKKAIVISTVLVLAVIGSAVFASGMLNGKLVDEPELVSSEMKEPALEKKELGNPIITHDNDTGKANKVTDEPKLVAESAQVTDASEKSSSNTNTQSEEEISEPILDVIELDASMENPVDGEISISLGAQEHNGIDIKAAEGTDVVSSIKGTVTDVGFDSKKGNYIVVENGNIKTLYAQLAETKVNKGDKITAKQSIGTVGKTGTATGAHLHFEVMVDGEQVDPTNFIK